MPMLEESSQILQYVPTVEIFYDKFGMAGTYRAYHTKELQYAISIEHHS
jgi:hypothetical protein